MERSLRTIGLACMLAAMMGSALAEDNPTTRADQKNLIAGLCTTQMDLSPQGCTCVAERALVELDDNQRAYLVLSVVQPQAAEKMPIASSKDELAAIFNFLGAAHESCAKQTTGPAQGGGAGPDQPAAQ